MKKLILLVAVSIILFGCKKTQNTQSTSASLEVQVSGLTDKTSIYINIINNSKENAIILDLQNKFGNTTYKTAAVNVGDKLTIKYKCNMASNLNNDGVGTIKFYYKGGQCGAVGGALGTSYSTITQSVLAP